MPSLVFQLWSALLITSFLAVGLIIGEANVQNPSLQANTPPRLPTKTWFKFNIQTRNQWRISAPYVSGRKLHAVNMVQNSTTDLWKVVDVLVGVLLVGVWV